MRSVLFIRHAKSSWDDPLMNDFDRPLNDRGKKDAPQMAKYLLEKKIQIDSFISSPAKRARKTAALFAKAFGIDENAIQLKSQLYLPDEVAFSHAIETASDKYAHLAIFSHNPGITHFVNSLTSQVRVDNIPTCGIFGIKSNAISWKDFEKAEKEFWFFDYPGNHGLTHSS
ncbi:phosphohistidine phosphatase [Terrimonas sp.]|uniref:SixA phosphatase family protein n=1 Tax=Terrimonas sp. TaxID=1914338 RepID=UPI000D50A9BD|nr:histidine phosphatase family protein [Terrimonas sp.]PVD51152.1 phosphohistidine phosphatase [Terrimonas sp.]